METLEFYRAVNIIKTAYPVLSYSFATAFQQMDEAKIVIKGYEIEFLHQYHEGTVAFWLADGSEPEIESAVALPYGSKSNGSYDYYVLIPTEIYKFMVNESTDYELNSENYTILMAAPIEDLANNIEAYNRVLGVDLVERIIVPRHDVYNAIKKLNVSPFILIYPQRFASNKSIASNLFIMVPVYAGVLHELALDTIGHLSEEKNNVKNHSVTLDIDLNKLTEYDLTKLYEFFSYLSVCNEVSGAIRIDVNLVECDPANKPVFDAIFGFDFQDI